MSGMWKLIGLLVFVVVTFVQVTIIQSLYVAKHQKLSWALALLFVFGNGSGLLLKDYQTSVKSSKSTPSAQETPKDKDTGAVVENESMMMY